METIKDLVSVIIPCYNMANRIHRLFDSLLAQTYQYLHIILINDESTDKSEDVILEYKKKFESRGIEFLYIKQKNTGVGGVINNGLKYVKGEFFIWPDADDWLASNSVELRVQFLKNNPEYGFVRSDAYLFYESDLKHPIGFQSNKHPDRLKTENLLMDYIWERNANYCPGCHMIRTTAFNKVCADMEIYSARGGQNFQLLAPMLCVYKFGYIDEPLYYYVIYKKSLSHGDTTFDDYIKKIGIAEDIRVQTIKSLPVSEDKKKDYTNQVYQKSNISRAQISYNFGEKKAFEHYYNTIDKQYLPESLSKIQKSSFLKSNIWLTINKHIFKISNKFKQSSFAYFIRTKRFQIKYQ